MSQTFGPKGWSKGKIDPKSALIHPFLSLYRKLSRQALPFSQREALLGFSPNSWSSKLKHVSLRISCSYPYTSFASWTCVFPLRITVVICPCSTVFTFSSLNCLRNCGAPLFVSKISLSSSFQVREARTLLFGAVVVVLLIFCDVWAYMLLWMYGMVGIIVWMLKYDYIGKQWRETRVIVKKVVLIWSRQRQRYQIWRRCRGVRLVFLIFWFYLFFFFYFTHIRLIEFVFFVVFSFLFIYFKQNSIFVLIKNFF